MGAYDFKSLYEHLNHRITLATYGRAADGGEHDPSMENEVANVAVECEDCNCVLLDFDNPGNGDYSDTGEVLKVAVHSKPPKRLDRKRELVLKLSNGWSIRIGPGEEYQWGAYARVCDKRGREVVYYDKAEWEASPEEVIGCIFSCAFNQGRMR